MAYNALPPRPRGESRYIAAVIPNGLIKGILNNTKLGKKKGGGGAKCIYSVLGWGKMLLLLWGWAEEVLLPTLKSCGAPVGSGGRQAPQFSRRNL